MHKWLVPAVLALSMGSATDVMAQSRNLTGPKELPPASFKGQQFVDSRGCVFMRAGVGGQVNWVARISRDRKQLCGQLPTFGANQVKVDDGPLPPKGMGEDKPQVAAKPPSPSPSPAPAPTVLSAKPVTAPADTPSTTRPMKVTVAPPVVPSAPPQTVAVKPVVTKPAQPKSAPSKAAAAKPKVVVPRPNLQASLVPPDALPPGYRRVVPPGRMDSLSGVGGAQGWQEQDQIWTRETPARLIDTPRRNAPVAQEVSAPQTPEPRANVKTRPSKAAAAQIQAAGQGRYVQVGSYAEAGNAGRAIHKLQALGLPVAKAPMRSKGRQLQVVLAGPFASSAEAQHALRAARGAGFRDAYVR